MSTTVLKKQGKVEASDLYELAKKGLITHTGMFEVEGKNRDLKGLRGANKEKLENSEYLLQQGLVTVTFGDSKPSENQPEKGKENKEGGEKENGKTPVEPEKGKEGAKPSVIKEEGSESEGLPLSEKPEETKESKSEGSEEKSESSEE